MGCIRMDICKKAEKDKHENIWFNFTIVLSQLFSFLSFTYGFFAISFGCRLPVSPFSIVSPLVNMTQIQVFIIYLYHLFFGYSLVSSICFVDTTMAQCVTFEIELQKGDCSCQFLCFKLFTRMRECTNASVCMCFLWSVHGLCVTHARICLYVCPYRVDAHM